jgi:hypothetical protein
MRRKSCFASVFKELLEEGNSFEAGVVFGVENAKDPSVSEVTTSHLINASTKLSSRRGRALQGSSERIVRSGPLTYESSVAKQTAAQFSSVGDTAVGGASPGSYFFD